MLVHLRMDKDKRLSTMQNLSEVIASNPEFLKETLKSMGYFTIAVVCVYCLYILFFFTKKTNEKLDRWSRFDPKGEEYEEANEIRNRNRFAFHFLLPLFYYLLAFVFVISSIYFTFIN